MTRALFDHAHTSTHNCWQAPSATSCSVQCIQFNTPRHGVEEQYQTTVSNNSIKQQYQTIQHIQTWGGRTVSNKRLRPGLVGLCKHAQAKAAREAKATAPTCARLWQGVQARPMPHTAPPAQLPGASCTDAAAPAPPSSCAAAGHHACVHTWACMAAVPHACACTCWQEDGHDTLHASHASPCKPCYGTPSIHSGQCNCRVHSLASSGQDLTLLAIQPPRIKDCRERSVQSSKADEEKEEGLNLTHFICTFDSELNMCVWQ